MLRPKGSQEKSTTQYRYHAVPTNNNANTSSSNLDDGSTSPRRIRGEHQQGNKAGSNSLLGSNRDMTIGTTKNTKVLSNINNVGKTASAAATAISVQINKNLERWKPIFKKGTNGKDRSSSIQLCLYICSLILVTCLLLFANKYLIQAIGLIFCQFTVGLGGNILIYHDPYIEPNIPIYHCAQNLHTYLYSIRQTQSQVNNNNLNNNAYDKNANIIRLNFNPANGNNINDKNHNNENNIIGDKHFRSLINSQREQMSHRNLEQVSKQQEPNILLQGKMFVEG